MGLGSHRQNIMTDSSHELITRYAEMIMGKSTEEWSSQNGIMLRCTGDIAEVEVLINVKDSLLIHKRDLHSCTRLRNMRACGFNHAEQASCTLI